MTPPLPGASSPLPGMAMYATIAADTEAHATELAEMVAAGAVPAAAAAAAASFFRRIERAAAACAATLEAVVDGPRPAERPAPDEAEPTSRGHRLGWRRALGR